MGSFELPPGPTEPSPFQALRFAADPYGYLERCQSRYGATFTLRFPGDPPRVLMTEPEMVKQVFALGADDIRSDRQGVLLNVGPSSVLFLDGERHRRQRFAMHPVLHGEALASYAARMAELAGAWIGRWQVGRTLALHRELQRLTLDVFLACVFGAVEPERRRRLGEHVIRWLDTTLSAPVYALSLVVTGNRLRRMLDRAAAAETAGERPRHVGDAILRFIAKDKAELGLLLAEDVRRCRRDGVGDRKDVLARLVLARDEAGDPLTDDEIVDQLATLLVGGLETSAGTLAWSLHHLFQHPGAVERARGEVRAALDKDPRAVARGEELPFVDACIREGMRLSPVAPAISRQLARRTTIGRWTFEPDVYVWPCTYLVQRSAAHWERPEAFRPERFLGPPPGVHEFIPWGGGKRRCIGASFSALEMRIILAEVLARVTLRLERPERTRGVIRGITIVPSTGVPAVVTSKV